MHYGECHLLSIKVHTPPKRLLSLHCRLLYIYTCRLSKSVSLDVPIAEKFNPLTEQLVSNSSGLTERCLNFRLNFSLTENFSVKSDPFSIFSIRSSKSLKMFFFRKIHRDEFFKRQPLNQPVYRYRYLESPLYSIYEDYR